MSLFDLQDVCIVIGSLTTLDLPMIVDLIGIYVLKGPYCMLTMTNWFLQALSVIPRLRPTSLLPSAAVRRPLPSPIAAAPPPSDRTCFDHRAEEIPFLSNSSVLLVQANEGFVLPVMDLIRRSTAAYLLKCRFPCETGRSQAPRRQQGNNRDEEIPFLSNSSVLLVQANEGFVLPVMDLIRRSTAAYLLKCRFPYETGRIQVPRREQGNNR
ncbi:hypothetical protein F511_05786 [Dorcoceras hygrometricum]|uniref:Uncharacterized protein n=1 Tax=Dorcoceras hygrometricum TaxID=472368 RepID=A0A2Z7BA56_9LAMI|nr:hypothetical protein F511_05786 [Dorcoceras hygrometricum]